MGWGTMKRGSCTWPVLPKSCFPLVCCHQKMLGEFLNKGAGNYAQHLVVECCGCVVDGVVYQMQQPKPLILD